MPRWRVTKVYVVDGETEDRAIGETYVQTYDGYFDGMGVEVSVVAEPIDDVEAHKLSEEAGSEIHMLWEGEPEED